MENLIKKRFVGGPEDRKWIDIMCKYDGAFYEIDINCPSTTKGI